MALFSDISTLAFVFLGAALMVLSILKTRSILHLLEGKRYYRVWLVFVLFMVLFLMGYLGVFVLVFLGMKEAVLIFSGFGFLLGGLFVYFGVYVGKSTIFDMKQEIRERRKAEIEITQYKDHLEEQIQKRTTELRIANQYMLEDLSLAVDFQQAILPSLKSPPFLKAALRYIPCAEVSGDIYDVEINRENEFCFFLGDATGHGISAAFLTMMVSIGLETIPSNLASDEVLRRLNRLLTVQETGKSVTGIYLQINNKGKLRTGNAGHPPLFVIPHNGDPLVQLSAGGCPLGMFEEEFIAYVEETYHLADGDKIFIYTDGIEEWRNPSKEQFGLEALVQCLEDNRHLDVETTLDSLLKKATQFSQGFPCKDDITLLCFQFQKELS